MTATPDTLKILEEAEVKNYPTFSCFGLKIFHFHYKLQFFLDIKAQRNLVSLSEAHIMELIKEQKFETGILTYKHF